jgi:hypothetical protein
VELPDNLVGEVESLISLGYACEPAEGLFGLTPDGDAAALKVMASIPRRIRAEYADAEGIPDQTQGQTEETRPVIQA